MMQPSPNDWDYVGKKEVKRAEAPEIVDLDEAPPTEWSRKASQASQASKASKASSTSSRR